MLRVVQSVHRRVTAKTESRQPLVGQMELQGSSLTAALLRKRSDNRPFPDLTEFRSPDLRQSFFLLDYYVQDVDILRRSPTAVY